MPTRPEEEKCTDAARLTLPPFRILDEAACRRLHQEALALLRTKGFRVHSSQLCDRLAAAGAVVDGAREVVTLPPELVTEALAGALPRFHVHDLDGRPTRIQPGSIRETVGAYVEAVRWLDYGTEVLRPSTLADLQRALRVADALPLVKKTGVIVTPLDLPVEDQLRRALRAILTTTRKSPSFGIQNPDQAGLILDALAAAAPRVDLARQPVGTFACSPTSPLVLDADTGDTLMFAAGKGLVPILAPCPMAGGTSQMSVVGTVWQQVVENLFMVTAAYAVDPQGPILWGGAAAAMDMKAGDVSYGGVERSLMMLANIDMACHLGLPCHSPAASVDSCLPDAQLGAEKTWTYLTRWSSRAAMGIGVGAVTNGKAVSLEQMVIDVDLLASVRRLAAGIDMDRLPPAIDEVARIDHGGGFMTSEETLPLLREGEEYVYPATFNRGGTHAEPMVRRAHDRVEDILSEWRNPVPETIREDLERMLG